MDSLENRTRKVYEGQHRRIINDEVANTRLREMRSEKFFGLGEGYFKNKIALDAGCGNTAHLSIQLCKFGVEKVCAFDLGEDWISDAENELKKAGFNNKQFELLPGNILEIPYPDESFDFVASDGVMCHLGSLADFKRAFSELSRLCKSGGGYCISV